MGQMYKQINRVTNGAGKINRGGNRKSNNNVNVRNQPNGIKRRMNRNQPNVRHVTGNANGP